MHETYAIFDSKNMNGSSYNLPIKTTPRQVTSFQIISAHLPVLKNLPYISMKIQNLENTISLNDDSSNDNLFSLFYFHENDYKQQYKTFKTDNIYPNTIKFINPLQSLSRLQIKWCDHQNNLINFTQPRFEIQNNIYFKYDKSIHFGIIQHITINKEIDYRIQDCNDNEIYPIKEKDVIQFNINDKIFLYNSQKSKYYTAIVLNIYPYTVYTPHDKNIIHINAIEFV